MLVRWEEYARGPEIADEFSLPHETVRAALAYFGRPAEADAAFMDLPGAISALKKIEGFANDTDFVKQLLWCGQTHLRPILNDLGAFDLSIVGKFGSGKSFVTYYSTFLARNGIVVVDFSEASLSAVLDAGMDLGFEEADELLKAHRNDLVEAILRSGQTPWAVRALMAQDAEKDKDGHRWHLSFQSLAGPKVYNYAGIVKPATASRAAVIQIDPTKDVWIVLRSFVAKRFLAPVRLWLEREVKRALPEWSKDRAERTILSEDFAKEVAALPTEFPRGQRIGALMLLAARILGWDIGKAISEVVEQQPLWQDNEDVLEVAEFIAKAFMDVPPGEYKAILKDESAGPMLNPTALLSRFNESRPKERPVGKNEWATILRQIGFREGASKVKDDHGKIGPRGRWYLRLTPDVAQRLTYLVPTFTMVGAVGAVGAEGQQRLHMEREDSSGSNGTNGTNVGEDAGKLEAPIAKDQNPDRMWAFDYARNKARVHRGVPVDFAYGDGLKEYRTQFNRDPDPDQFRAGIIGGLKADEERRRADSEPSGFREVSGGAS